MAMIVCHIEMWPQGERLRKRDLATIVIANEGGDTEKGDYGFAISHQLDSSFSAGRSDVYDLYAHGKNAWKRGTVTGFRRSLGVVRLLSNVLGKAFK